MPWEFQLDFDGPSDPLRWGKLGVEGLCQVVKELSEKGLKTIHLNSVQMSDQFVKQEVSRFGKNLLPLVYLVEFESLRNRAKGI